MAKGEHEPLSSLSSFAGGTDLKLGFEAVIVMSQSEIMLECSSNLDDVRDVIARALGIDLGRIPAASTRLFGSLPELDSFGVVELVVALEERFGFSVDDSDFSADLFATVGTLAAFVEKKRK